jgi:hypothetical protein
MPREVTDASGTTWTCIQAFAGLGGGAEKTRAARVEGSQDRFRVVCTPSGGAKSTQVELPGNWEAELPDEDLAEAIRAKLAEDG